MTELEKAEQEIAAARVAERVAEWKAMEAKASYYRYASEAMAASAEVMGARIRRDSAQASEWADAVLAKGEPLLDPVPSPSPESSSQETVTEAAEPHPVAYFSTQDGLIELRDDGSTRNMASEVAEFAASEAAKASEPPSEPQSQSEGAGERVEQTENPAAAMFGKALAAESEAKEQRKYNPFAIFGAKVDA